MNFSKGWTCNTISEALSYLHKIELTDQELASSLVKRQKQSLFTEQNDYFVLTQKDKRCVKRLPIGSKNLHEFIKQLSHKN